jgi:hypothetical protein
MNIHVVNHLDNLSDESLSYITPSKYLDDAIYSNTCEELIETYDIHGNLLFLSYGEIE